MSNAINPTYKRIQKIRSVTSTMGIVAGAIGLAVLAFTACNKICSEHKAEQALHEAQNPAWKPSGSPFKFNGNTPR